jgi:hypothetical protein
MPIGLPCKQSERHISRHPTGDVTRPSSGNKPTIKEFRKNWTSSGNKASLRGLAAQYRKSLHAVALDYPRTSALLGKIARSFDVDGRDEDEAAEQRQWL